MIVVDTNLVAYLFLTGDRSAQIEQVFQKDPEWCAPLLWRSEFRSVLTSYIRKNIFSIADAVRIMDEASHLMAEREYSVGSVEVLSLTASSSCSADDCEFVALARVLEIPLVTVDRQILAAFPDLALSPEQFI